MDSFALSRTATPRLRNNVKEEDLRARDEKGLSLFTCVCVHTHMLMHEHFCFCERRRYVDVYASGTQSTILVLLTTITHLLVTLCFYTGSVSGLEITN